jgi:hypothetical protein
MRERGEGAWRDGGRLREIEKFMKVRRNLRRSTNFARLSACARYLLVLTNGPNLHARRSVAMFALRHLSVWNYFSSLHIPFNPWQMVLNLPHISFPVPALQSTLSPSALWRSSPLQPPLGRVHVNMLSQCTAVLPKARAVLVFFVWRLVANQLSLAARTGCYERWPHLDACARERTANAGVRMNSRPGMSKRVSCGILPVEGRQMQ